MTREGLRSGRQLGCARAREWAALGADGELSELERLLLGRHLSRCEECRSFAETVSAATRLLRSTPVERPARTLAPRVQQEPRFDVRYRLAAAALVLAAALGSVVGTLRDRPAPAPRPEEPQLVLITPTPGAPSQKVTPAPGRPKPVKPPEEPV